MDFEEELLLVLIIYWYWKTNYSSPIERIRDNTSALSGHAYTLELLNGSNTQCVELMRLSRDAYILLCNHFKQKNWLQDSRHVTVEEKMAIFLTIIGHNERFRMVKRRFQHSTETIHRYFREVLRAMMKFAKEAIRPTHFEETPTPERQRNLRRIFPGAIGALDGTLIHAIVPVDQQARYRGRGRGECYQNVLGICDFNMIFTYVWAGWEGIAHDARILREVAFSPTSGFPFPPQDKYYLCDAAYANTRGFMTPYRNTRCNIHDQLFMDFDNDPLFIPEGLEEIEGGDEDDMDARLFIQSSYQTIIFHSALNHSEPLNHSDLSTIQQQIIQQLPNSTLDKYYKHVMGMKMKMKMGMQENGNENEHCIDADWLTHYNQ
ncbi:hypothetical protein OSB04_004290 [Centaurea solstitialis]|uniref:DDE Tnp4 domain-containing protein n=1 Tax=Centaurea solstitialis TaxID=347529 RepID=A0AA38WVJ7_9ASTR|nr:hypothetical protein OSB04_004290 [Centaurea solstitialis]